MNFSVCVGVLCNLLSQGAQRRWTVSSDSLVKLPAHVLAWLPFPPQGTTGSESWKSLSWSVIPGLLLGKAGCVLFSAR